MTRGDGAFLLAADLLEHGAVSEATEAAVRRRIAADIRSELPHGAREAIADAYRARGEAVPEWCDG